MSRPGNTWKRWDTLRGYNTRDVPQALPDAIGTACTNVELNDTSLGQRRPSTVAIALTSGPTTIIYFLCRHQTSTSAPQLWAFDESGAGAALAAFFYTVAGIWTATTLIDTPATAVTAYPTAASLNNKLFLCYDSAVNRLHCYDGTSWRRVGVAAPAAPTVADGGGGGAYAATARRYRTQQFIKSGSTYVAVSELSSAVSFTPSGLNANATVTKSATVDGATHWAVYGLISTAGDTYDLYEKISADIVVATPTFADTVDPASYDGEAPPQLGLNIPPPSAKYIITDGNRLIMAGCFETTATAGQTTPKNSRVWFTRVLGSTDTFTDDETIPNSTTNQGFIDCGENDGDLIVGLGGPIDGILIVFKNRSIWRLSPTGQDTKPYRAEIITTSIGAVVTGTPTASNHLNIVLAETDAGQPLLYFMARSGAYRMSPATGIEYVGWDITSPITGAGPICVNGVWHAAKRQIWWVEDDSVTIHVYTPHLAWQADDRTWRGGWSRYTLPGTSEILPIAIYEATAVTGTLFPTLGMRLGVSPRIQYFGSTSASDVNGTYAPTITSKPFLLHPQGTQRAQLYPPVLEAAVESGATPSVSFILDHGRDTRTGTCPNLVALGTETRRLVSVEGVEGADAQVAQVRVTWDTDQTQSIDAVLLQYRLAAEVL